MEIYQNESEQVLAIKQFFDKYKSIMLIGIVVLVAIIIGARYWQNHTLKVAGQASDIYQAMLMADYQKDINTVNEKGAILVKDFRGTPYADLGALLLAKNAVEAQDMPAAEQHLRWIIEQNNSKNVALHIATVRLANILTEKGEYNVALEMLSKSSDNAYAAIYNEAKGDVYTAQGLPEQAKQAYLTAMYHLPPGAVAPILQMKLADLGVGEDQITQQGEQHA